MSRMIAEDNKTFRRNRFVWVSSSIEQRWLCTENDSSCISSLMCFSFLSLFVFVGLSLPFLFAFLFSLTKHSSVTFRCFVSSFFFFFFKYSIRFERLWIFFFLHSFPTIYMYKYFMYYSIYRYRFLRMEIESDSLLIEIDIIDFRLKRKRILFISESFWICILMIFILLWIHTSISLLSNLFYSHHPMLKNSVVLNPIVRWSMVLSLVCFVLVHDKQKQNLLKCRYFPNEIHFINYHNNNFDQHLSQQLVEDLHYLDRSLHIDHELI